MSKSIFFLNLIIDWDNLTGIQKIALQTLRPHTGLDVSQVAQMTKASRRKVRKQLRRLVDMDLLREVKLE